LVSDESTPQMPDVGALLDQAQQMMQAHSEAKDQMVEGRSGGGAVKVTMTGDMEFKSVTIDPAAVDPADVGMLEDLVLAALRDAMTEVNKLKEGAMGGIDLGGLDLGGLLGGDS